MIMRVVTIMIMIMKLMIMFDFVSISSIFVANSAFGDSTRYRLSL